MQTFLPFPDLQISCQVLDDRRLGKQRVETYQVLRALTWPQYAWKNHPAVRMWRGFVPGLVAYGLANCQEWTRRGYADAVAPQLLAWTGGEQPQDYELPPWFGLEALHLSHRSSLLRKEPDWYRPRFAAAGLPDEPDDLPYLWPDTVFPRWPVRGGVEGVPLEEAARLLGLPAPYGWQRQAAEAVAAGADVLATVRPGCGGSTTALLAGLSLPGRTLWVSPWDGPVAGPVPQIDPPAPRPAPDPATPVADRPPPLARPAGPADTAAMTAEQAPPEFLFAHPDRLPAAARDVSLVVLDRVQRLTGADVDAVAAVREVLPGVPVLALAAAADDVGRRRLADRLGLRGWRHVGGGWDPADSFLAVKHAATGPQRRPVLAGQVRAHGPALVVTTDRQRADRLVTGLAADRLRTAVWAPAPMRATRATAAVAAWRTRRLDALVVPAGELPPLGRVRVRLLVGDGAAVDGAQAWHALVDAVRPERAVLLVGPDATVGAADLAAQDGCRRAALLDPFGEPVAGPCGRCDQCPPAG